MKFSKPVFALAIGCLAAVISVVFGFLCKYRIFPFLAEDTVLSGGKEVPPEQLAETMSTVFWWSAPAMVAVGVLNFFLLKRGNQN